MFRVFIGLILSLSLLGCKTGIVIDIDTEHLQNPEVDGQYLRSLAYVEFTGKCYEGGVESESLVKINGAFFNIFKQEHEFLSCETEYFTSRAEYVIYIGLDTVKDGVDSSGKLLTILSGEPEGHIVLVIDDETKKRLNKRLRNQLSIKTELSINIYNNKKQDVYLHTLPSYIYKDGKYQPENYLNLDTRKETIYIRYSDVSKDMLLNNGGTYLFRVERK